MFLGKNKKTKTKQKNKHVLLLLVVVLKVYHTVDGSEIITDQNMDLQSEYLCSLYI